MNVVVHLSECAFNGKRCWQFRKNIIVCIRLWLDWEENEYKMVICPLSGKHLMVTNLVGINIKQFKDKMRFPSVDNYLLGFVLEVIMANNVISNFQTFQCNFSESVNKPLLAKMIKAM